MSTFEPQRPAQAEEFAAAPAGAAADASARNDFLGEMEALDLKLLRSARERWHDDPVLVERVSQFSRTGEHGAAWIALGTAGLLLSRSPKRRAAWADGVTAVVFSVAANFVVKSLVERPRPELEDLPPLSPVITQLSFPSAHATASFTAARMFSRANPLATPIFYGAAGAFAYSRPYLGVHYPSDVIGGAVLGTVIGSVWPRSRVRPNAKLRKISKRKLRKASKKRA